ncbi:hypothetical protein OfM1_14040 [Lactovum odontotermitis]
MRKKSGKIVISICMILVFFGLSGYFCSFVVKNSYIGIRAVNQQGTWKVKRFFLSGEATRQNVKVGDVIVKINQIPASKNQVLKKWLIVEQAKDVSVRRNGKSINISFDKKGDKLSLYISLIVIASILVAFSIILFLRSAFGSSGYYFISFLYFFGLALVSAIPSSMGVDAGRVLVIASISFLPLYLNFFIKKLTFREKTGSSFFDYFYLALGGVSVVSGILNAFFVDTLIVRLYLATGTYYFLGFSIILIALQYVVGRYKEKRDVFSKVNIFLLAVLSLSPLFLFYVFPTPWTAPVEVLILFVLLPAGSIFYLLIINKILVYQKGIHRLAGRILGSLYVAVLISLLAILGSFVPSYVVSVYSCLFFFVIFPMIDDFFSTYRKEDSKHRDLELFFATEEERERISLHIHDTIIQDTIFEMKKIEMDKEALNKKRVINLLDDTIYQLREICSNVYPVVLRENGFLRALQFEIKRYKQKYPVEIVYSFPDEGVSLGIKEENFVLRTTKEMINNSILHGGATEISICVRENNHNIEVHVDDNGTFVESQDNLVNHFGLFAIKEKLALLGGNIDISVSGGTKIVFTIPK